MPIRQKTCTEKNKDVEMAKGQNIKTECFRSGKRRETSYDGNKVSSTLIKKAIPTQLVVKSQQPIGFSVIS